MKRIISYLSVSLLVFGLSGCVKEIVDGGQPDQPAVCGSPLTVTGTIFQDPESKVTFAEESNSIYPEWEVGDRVFGFYGESTLTYEVAGVSDGLATFDLVSGTEPGNGTKVHMIYAPGKSVSDLSEQTLAVDLSSQAGTLASMKSNAIMCATATVDGTRLHFEFENQVAIVGVRQFTGLKAGTTYTSATFTTAGPTGKVKVDGGVLKLVTDDAYGTITATGSFASDASGNTTDAIYFAVPPTTAVAHTFCLHSSDDHRAGSLSPKEMTAGKFLYMNSKAMTQTLYFDDFEGWAANSWPTNMASKHGGDGSSAVTTDHKNGSKGFKISSTGYYAMVAFCNDGNFMANLGVALAKGQEIFLETYIKHGESDKTFDFGLWHTNDSHPRDYAVAYSANQCFAMSMAGNLYESTKPLVNGRWYHLKIQYFDIYNAVVHKSRVWIDGVPFTNGVNDYFENAGGVPVNTFRFCENAYSAGASYDDVIVYLKPDSSASSPVTPEYVDLGLPSGTLWATFNLGAGKPEDYGDYYAWGETRAFGETNESNPNLTGIKTACRWSDYKYCDAGNERAINKYNTDGTFGYVDNKTVLEPQDDAASVNWGGGWRMPTAAEFSELINSSYTTCENTTSGVVNGLLITSKSNGRSIFLPKAGWHFNYEYGEAGSAYFYWSSDLFTDHTQCGYRLRSSNGVNKDGRIIGGSIRPVRSNP